MEKKTKHILIGLGTVALGTGAYILYQQSKKRKAASSPSFDELPSMEPSSPIPVQIPTSSGSSSGGFPIRKGSRGSLVTSLQNALIKKYGAGILPKYGADGHFGSEMQNALSSKGLPTRIDSDLFTKIILSVGSSSTGSSTGSGASSTDIATDLHNAISRDDLNSAITTLRKIKDVSGYSAVSSLFKQTRIGFVRKTLVTGLLDRFNSTSEKKKLNQEFYRIGLKYDGSKWSLSGGMDVLMDQLVTIEPTKVWDSSGKTIKVPKGTILGEYLDANNGSTEFETVDRKRLFVKTSSISYV